MATSKEDISRWFDNGVKMKATHLIVVCDTFSYEDYPCYVAEWESVEAKINEKNNYSNMSKVMEVYNLKLDKTSQMNEYRAFNL